MFSGEIATRAIENFVMIAWLAQASAASESWKVEASRSIEMGRDEPEQLDFGTETKLFLYG